MHVNFGLPAPSGINCSPWPPYPSTSINTNNCASPPLLQQNTAQQHWVYPTLAQQLSSSGVPIPVPDLQFIKSVPPPSLLNRIRVPEIPPPQRNQASTLNNFIDPMNRYPPRPPNGCQFSPPVPPSTNYNNSNSMLAHNNSYQAYRNAMPESPARQPSNPFQSNLVTSPTNICPVQPTRNQSYGSPSFSNDRYSPNSKPSYPSQGFGSPFNSSPGQVQLSPGLNANGQFRQSPPFMMDSSSKTTQNGDKFHHYNRGIKRNHSSDSYPNQNNPFSMNQGNWQKNTPVRNRYGEKRVKTEGNSQVSKQHYCDTCDRAFASEAEMEHHISEHVKCDSGNCQFEAHHKIVALHKKMQHDTGYADSISKLKNAEEIEKWRAERRRRFPTKENIEKRKAELAEKEARGEVIENKDFGKFKRPNNDNMKFKKRRRGSNKMKNGVGNPHRSAPSVVDISDSESDSDDSHIKLPKFLGMKYVPEDKDVLRDKDSPEIENLNGHSDESVILETKEDNCNSNENMNTETLDSENKIADHLDVENKNEDHLDVENKNGDHLDVENKNGDHLDVENKNGDHLDVENKNGDHLDVENKNGDHLDVEIKNEEHLKARARKDFHGNREYSLPPQRAPLLEKLLAPEIRHERNVIMQCIRHIVNNGFFDQRN